MGFIVVLEDESGRELGRVVEPSMGLAGILPGVDAVEFPALRWVDQFVDTSFNETQIPYLVDDLQRIADRAKTEQERASIGDILGLALGGLERHRRIKFLGD